MCNFTPKSWDTRHRWGRVGWTRQVMPHSMVRLSAGRMEFSQEVRRWSVFWNNIPLKVLLLMN